MEELLSQNNRISTSVIQQKHEKKIKSPKVKEAQRNIIRVREYDFEVLSRTYHVNFVLAELLHDIKHFVLNFVAL